MNYEKKFSQTQGAAVGKHLDLGCGNIPKNPYKQNSVYGIDIREGLGVNIKSANLAIQSIPYPDNHFESISAYDFLEHVPRVVVDVSSAKTIFPFVELMNEIWRVLQPSGKFYAVTPAYPSHKAFVDPTHVNFISKKTHEYFTGTDPLARMYGFTGNFDVIRIQRIRPREIYTPQHFSLAEKIKDLSDMIKLRRSHLIWELRKSSI